MSMMWLISFVETCYMPSTISIKRPGNLVLIDGRTTDERSKALKTTTGGDTRRHGIVEGPSMALCQALRLVTRTTKDHNTRRQIAAIDAR